MPTPAERKALLFLAGVIVLGASVRVVRAARDEDNDDPAARQALTRQLAAVDSAHTDVTKGPSRSTRRPSGRRSSARRAGDSTRVASSSTVVGDDRIARDTHPTIVDLDVASESDIETLPRIGPVLARRIVEDRSANGPFGSLDGFERVRGVGPSLARTLRARVTFSGTARPSNAVVDHRLRSPPTSPKPPRRERRQ